MKCVYFGKQVKNEMKPLLFICAAVLFIGVFPLPIGYYTLLRIVVCIGAIAVIVSEYDSKLTYWVIVFGLVAILFNPLFPVYFRSKTAWIPIDIIAGILFIVKAFIQTTTKNHKQ